MPDKDENQIVDHNGPNDDGYSALFSALTKRGKPLAVPGGKGIEGRQVEMDNAKIAQLVAVGHSEECACNMVCGDGKCECVPESIVRTHPHFLRLVAALERAYAWTGTAGRKRLKDLKVEFSVEHEAMGEALREACGPPGSELEEEKD